MKVGTKILVPFILGFLVSACSTSPQQENNAVVISESDKTEELALDNESLLNEENANLKEQLASKDAKIYLLEQQIADHNKQITLLNQTLIQKDAVIDSLEQRLLEDSSTSEEGFQQSYYDLLRQNTDLQEKYDNLAADNELNQRQLTTLKKENQLLDETLSDVIAKLSEQNSISLADRLKAQNNILQLETALVESASSKRDLENKLAQAQEQNALLTAQLNVAEVQLVSNQTELNDLRLRLNETQGELDQQKLDGISIAAIMEALQLQMTSNIQSVRWQLPNEMALHDTFEILVTANVQAPVVGQVYQAELVTDSAIQMISGRIANAIVQNGQLLWRWRIAGLNEKPDAQLNLFVNQQINIQEQTVMRQVYRGNETLSLVNTNLFEKYGYWSGAILLGLLGGFLIGRLNNRKKNEL